MRIFSLWPIVAAALLGACASTPDATPPMLVGTHWLRVDDEDASPHFPTLDFGEHGASGVMPGCGDWSAVVQTAGERLSFARLAPAHPQCEAQSAVGAAARSFMAALKVTRSARLADGELILFDARGAPVARLQAND